LTSSVSLASVRINQNNFSIVRALGSLVVLTNNYSHGFYWGYLLSICLPTLLFITTLSVFIFYFALLVMEEESDSTNLLKPFFMVLNAMSYFAFIMIAIYYSGQIYYLNDQFLKALCALFGVVFLVFTICMGYYGYRISDILSNISE
jgi:hypothetical protein